VRVFDDGYHEIRSLTFADPEREALAQSANRAIALEAGEARPEHELHGRDELGRMWTQREECGDAELLEERVALRVSAAHQHDHFVVQLERAGLELDTTGTCTLSVSTCCDGGNLENNISMSNKKPKSIVVVQNRYYRARVADEPM
jgi:hypothetical protein